MVDMVVMAAEERQTRVQADSKDERKREWALNREKWNVCEKAKS